MTRPDKYDRFICWMCQQWSENCECDINCSLEKKARKRLLRLVREGKKNEGMAVGRCLNELSKVTLNNRKLMAELAKIRGEYREGKK